MKRILISTIVRNRETRLDTWYNQIKKLVLTDTDNKYYLSVYENDSTDNSKEILKSFDFSFFEDFSIQTENLGTTYYNSIQSNDRVLNLALARNKTIFAKDFIKKCSSVLSIEPDIVYDVDLVIKEIIDSDHDIISAISIQGSVIPYDGWATRKTAHEEYWDYSIELKDKINVWSTFNCLCLYNIEPFLIGCTFGGFNLRLKKYDCDTTVICENFRSLGYNDIVLNCNVAVNHLI